MAYPPRDPRIIPAIAEPLPSFWREKLTVAFLTDRSGTPIGTAFFVVLDEAGGRQRPPPLYLVTAAHNVVGYEDDTCVRLTRRGGGGVEDLETHRWVPHPNEQVDIAVSPVSPIVAHRFEIGFFHVPPVGDDDGFFGGPEWEPDDGDDVYYIGLLGDVDEMGRNKVPMVRSGTLGAWAQPGVPWRDAASKRDPGIRRTAATAHLVDVHSHSGFSGSPCIAFEAAHRGEYGTTAPEEFYSLEEVVRDAFTRRDRVTLIGLISGHFPHREKAVTSEGDEIEVYINAGVAVVTPATYIQELLHMDELKNDREAREKGEPEDGYISDTKRPGPEPERLQSDETIEDLAKRVMDAGKPDDWDEEEPE